MTRQNLGWLHSTEVLTRSSDCNENFFVLQVWDKTDSVFVFCGQIETSYFFNSGDACCSLPQGRPLLLPASVILPLVPVCLQKKKVWFSFWPHLLGGVSVATNKTFLCLCSTEPHAQNPSAALSITTDNVYYTVNKKLIIL